MALTDNDWNELLYVISGALATLDVKIRSLEAVQLRPIEDLEAIKQEVRQRLFKTLHRQFERTLKASHEQRSHEEMDQLWMEQQMDPPDDVPEGQ